MERREKHIHVRKIEERQKGRRKERKTGRKKGTKKRKGPISESLCFKTLRPQGKMDEGKKNYQMETKKNHLLYIRLRPSTL